MTTYRKRTQSRIYRKIYEQHYGPIPVDSDGRTYEIHHVDGNTENNDPTNLVALSIQDHYNIHYAQGDLSACLFIAGNRLNKSPEELSDLSRSAQKKLVEEGRHNFIGGKIQTISNRRRVNAGTHHLLGGTIQKESTKKRIINGTHNSLRTGYDAPAHKDVEYSFIHNITGEVVIATQYDMVKRYNLNNGNLSSVTSGKRKSTGGWSLLKTE